MVLYADWVQFFGAVALLASAALFVFIGLETGRFNQHGRSALFAAAGLLMSISTIRLLVFSDAITATTGKKLNGLFAVVFLVIIAEDLLLEKIEKRVEREQRERKAAWARHEQSRAPSGPPS